MSDTSSPLTSMNSSRTAITRSSCDCPSVMMFCRRSCSWHCSTPWQRRAPQRRWRSGLGCSWTPLTSFCKPSGQGCHDAQRDRRIVDRHLLHGLSVRLRDFLFAVTLVHDGSIHLAHEILHHLPRSVAEHLNCSLHGLTTGVSTSNGSSLALENQLTATETLDLVERPFVWNGRGLRHVRSSFHHLRQDPRHENGDLLDAITPGTSVTSSHNSRFLPLIHKDFNHESEFLKTLTTARLLLLPSNLSSGWMTQQRSSSPTKFCQFCYTCTLYASLRSIKCSWETLLF